MSDLDIEFGVVMPYADLTPEGITQLHLEQLLADEPDPPAWVWHGRLERGTLTLLHGDGGLGKSLIALALGRAVMRNRQLLGAPTCAGTVAIIDGENPARDIHRRLHGFNIEVEELGRLTYYRADQPLLESEHAETFLRDIAARATLLVLDSQRALWGGDENDPVAIRELYRMLARVAEATDAAILLLHHDNKSGGYSGSTDQNASVNSRLHLARKTKVADDPVRQLRHEKARSGPEMPTIELEIGFDAGYTIKLADETTSADATARPIIAKAAAFVRRKVGATTAEIAHHCSVTERTVRRWREELAAVRIHSDREGNFWPAASGRPGGHSAETDSSGHTTMPATESADLQGKSSVQQQEADGQGHVSASASETASKTREMQGGSVPKLADGHTLPLRGRSDQAAPPPGSAPGLEYGSEPSDEIDWNQLDAVRGKV